LSNKHGAFKFQNNYVKGLDQEQNDFDTSDFAANRKNPGHNKLSIRISSNHSPHSVTGLDYRKRASPPDSKVSYHSHYLMHDASPESLVLDNVKGPPLRMPIEQLDRQVHASSLTSKHSNQRKRIETSELHFDQPPTLAVSNTQIFDSQGLGDPPKAQSSRPNNLTSGYFKNPGHQLKIDVDLSRQGMLPENNLNESCKTQGQILTKSKENSYFQSSNPHFGKNGKPVQTKYISLDPFADRKHSTRTDGEIRQFQARY
jgi:hypothetical protein